MTYSAVLAEPRFQAVFGSRLLATAAETLRILALSVLVFAGTGSPLLAAIAFGAGFLPQTVGGVLFGALADRAPPRRLIVAGHLLGAATAGVLAVAPLPPVWCIVVVAAVASVAPVFSGAAGRVVAAILPGDSYVLGRSLLGLTSSGAQLVGLACGGIALATLGPREALGTAAAGYLAAAVWAAIGLRHTLPVAESRPTKQSLLAQSWAGTADLWRRPEVRRLMLAQWLPPTLATAAEALLVPYAAARHLPAGATGPLLAAVPLGMLTGDLIVGRFLTPTVRERLAVPMVALIGAPLAVLATAPPFPAVLALLFVAGNGFGYSLGLQNRFRDAVPPSLHGQAFTLMSTGLMTLQGLGPVASGILAERVGPAVTITVAGLATIATAPLARVVRGVR